MASTPEPASGKPATETVRLPVELVKLAKILAAKADKSVPDYLAEKFGPMLHSLYRDMVTEMAKELKPRSRIS